MSSGLKTRLDRLERDFAAQRPRARHMPRDEAMAELRAELEWVIAETPGDDETIRLLRAVVEGPCWPEQETLDLLVARYAALGRDLHERGAPP